MIQSTCPGQPLSEKAAKAKALKDANQAALKACNYSCMECGRSYRKDGVRTKCHVRSYETLDVVVLCDDCRARQAAKAQAAGPWISAPVIVREANPACLALAPF